MITASKPRKNAHGEWVVNFRVHGKLMKEWTVFETTKEAAMETTYATRVKWLWDSGIGTPTDRKELKESISKVAHWNARGIIRLRTACEEEVTALAQMILQSKDEGLVNAYIEAIATNGLGYSNFNRTQTVAGDKYSLVNLIGHGATATRSIRGLLSEYGFEDMGYGGHHLTLDKGQKLSLEMRLTEVRISAFCHPDDELKHKLLSLSGFEPA